MAEEDGKAGRARPYLFAIVLARDSYYKKGANAQCMLMLARQEQPASHAKHP